MVGQRMDEDGGVLARLDDLVEVADRAAAHGRVSGPSIQTVSSAWIRDSGRPDRCR